MDLSLAPEDRELAAALDALLAKEWSPARVRAAEPTGFDAKLWRSLNDLGVPALAAGADAASALQLSLIAEQAGRHLASAPVVETLTTARLLARCNAELPGIVTLALHRTRSGQARLVPAGSVADIVVHYDGASLAAVTTPPPPAPTPNLGSQPLADRDLSSSDSLPLADGDEAAALLAAAQRDWQLMTAAQLVGVAARSLEIGVDYVRDRVIFDRAVGTFQTVAHRLADHATALDGAQLLVREAAWAVDSGADRATALTKMAFCFAAEQAVAIAADCLHYHGGYGFSLEYDIQLYYRRARAYPLVWGSVQQEYQAVADALYGES